VLGTQNLIAGATASRSLVSGTGFLYDAGGLAVSGTVISGGTEYVYLTGAGRQWQPDRSGGTQHVQNHGTASGTIVSGGHQFSIVPARRAAT